MKKKLFGIFALVLVMVCFVLVGCVIDENTDPEKSSERLESSPETDEKTVESNAETDEKKTETSEVSSEVISEESEEESTESFVIDVETFTPEGRLLGRLYEYLEWQNMEFELPDTRLERRIDQIINGDHPMLVDYDPDDIYYVCAYYNVEHNSETEEYCCKTEYTWVGFYSGKDIPETYLGKPLIAAFQINKAGQGKSIINEFEEPYFESIRMYQPMFENGKNIADSVKNDGVYLYICSNYELDDETIYVFSGYLTFFDVIYCVGYEGKPYINVYSGWEEDFDEELIEEALREEFGKYYDSLRPITVTNKCTKFNEYWGKTIKYAVIGLEDFAEFIKGVGEKGSVNE